MVGTIKPWGMEEKTFLLLMHLSQLTSFIVPFAGVLLPVIMWATNKAQSSEVDRHGKVILNWVISLMIYSAVSFILTFVFVGMFIFVVLIILNVTFVIIGGVKANAGELWSYPLSIKFLKVE